MKRFAMMILAGVLILALAACGDAEETVDFTSQEFLPRYDHNQSLTHLTTEFCRTEDTAYFYSGMYDAEEKRIVYVDLTTGIGGPLCGKPECSHTGSTCNAFSQYVEGLSLYDGRLCWLDFVSPTQGFNVVSAALDGTDRTVVRTVGFEALRNASNNRLVMFHRGYIYLCATTSTVIDGVPHYGSFVYTAPLEGDGEGTVILDNQLSDPECGVYVWMEPYRDSLYIVEATFLKKPYTLTLYRWDVTNQALETLFSGEVPFLCFEFWVTEDGILFSDQNSAKIYRYDFTSGELSFLFDIGGGSCPSLMFVDGLIVNRDLDDDGMVMIQVADFQGQMLFDQRVDLPNFLTDGYAWTLCGSDQNALYFCQYMWDSDYDIDHFLAEVSLDTGEVTILWREESEEP